MPNTSVRYQTMKKLIALFYLFPAAVLAEQTGAGNPMTWLEVDNPDALTVFVVVTPGCGFSAEEVHAQTGAILFASGIRPKRKLVTDVLLAVEIQCSREPVKSDLHVFSIEIDLVKMVFAGKDAYLATIWPRSKYSRFGAASSADILSAVSDGVGAFTADYTQANFAGKESE